MWRELSFEGQLWLVSKTRRGKFESGARGWTAKLFVLKPAAGREQVSRKYPAVFKVLPLLLGSGHGKFAPPKCLPVHPFYDPHDACWRHYFAMGVRWSRFQQQKTTGNPPFQNCRRARPLQLWRLGSRPGFLGHAAIDAIASCEFAIGADVVVLL